MPVPVLYQDPFSPVLFSSEVLAVTEEQKHFIREILDISSSDSKFAEKAYVAISKILTGGSTVVPVVASLSPTSATIGDPDVVLSVLGTGFTSTSVIVFNGGEEVTTFTSPTELKTTINMSTVSGPSVVPVAVFDSTTGVLSNAMDFSFVESGGGFSTFAAKSDASKKMPYSPPQVSAKESHSIKK